MLSVDVVSFTLHPPTTLNSCMAQGEKIRIKSNHIETVQLCNIQSPQENIEILLTSGLRYVVNFNIWNQVPFSSNLHDFVECVIRLVSIMVCHDGDLQVFE